MQARMRWASSRRIQPNVLRYCASCTCRATASRIGRGRGRVPLRRRGQALLERPFKSSDLGLEALSCPSDVEQHIVELVKLNLVKRLREDIRDHLFRAYQERRDDVTHNGVGTT